MPAKRLGVGFERAIRIDPDGGSIGGRESANGEEVNREWTPMNANEGKRGAVGVGF